QHAVQAGEARGDLLVPAVLEQGPHLGEDQGEPCDRHPEEVAEARDAAALAPAACGGGALHGARGHGLAQQREPLGRVDGLQLDLGLARVGQEDLHATDRRPALHDLERQALD
ncbi:MAG: hypothetical protein ACK559_15580, partial [bacterium]